MSYILVCYNNILTGFPEIYSTEGEATHKENPNKF
jgi:hypothetical protein